MHLKTANHFDDGNFCKLTIILLCNGAVDKKPMTRRSIRDHHKNDHWSCILLDYEALIPGGMVSTSPLAAAASAAL
jgi:hypothetical protein